jgi:hypothetical protein
MWLFVGLTLLILFGLLYTFAKVNQKEVLDHWEQYNKNPIFVFFFAPFYKPADDGRSQFQFAADNFYNVLMSFCDETMKVLMQPLMAIINMMTDAINQTVDGLFNVRGLLKVMWSRFNSMSEVFTKRFEATLNAMRATYTKLFNALGKTYAISIAGLMSGMAALQTTLSLFDLMVNVCLTILVILAAIFIWLPFLLIPVIIIIIMCVNAINESGQGDKVTGIAGVFCFAEDTQVDTKDGPQSIETIQLNQVLADNGVVSGILNFEHPINDMYSLYGVHVSGSHIVYENKKPLFVKDHPEAQKLPDQNRKVVCLITSTRRIPIVTPNGPINFADWEEIDNELEDLKEWNKQVFALLNPGQTYIEPTMTSLFSEAGVSGNTRIKTLNGETLKASEVRPGSTFLSADGTSTKVRGVVTLTGKEVVNSTYLSDGASISAGTWVKEYNTWIQRCHLTPKRPKESLWYQFFTESGTFVIQDGQKQIPVRDFTDVGSSEIHKTYDWVLKVLRQ